MIRIEKINGEDMLVLIRRDKSRYILAERKTTPNLEAALDHYKKDYDEIAKDMS